MGRLIDAVASLLNVVHTNEYEGHAAMLLEDLAWQGQMMDKACESITGFGISRVESCLYLDSRPVIRSIVDACLGGQSREVIAYGFHLAIAKLVIKAIEWLPDELREMKQIGLTGGVFQNRLLVEEIQRRASRIGYRVLVHRHIPPNDSGLSLGQLWFSQTGAEL